MKINFYLSTAEPSGGTFILMEYATRLQKLGNIVKCYVIVKPPVFKDATGKEKLYSIFPAMNIREIRRNRIIDNDLQDLQLRYPSVSIIKISSIYDKRIEHADCGIAGSWPAAYHLAESDRIKSKKIYLIQGFENWDRFGRGLKSYKLPLINICISNQLRKVIETNHYGTVTDVIYNGIDLNEFFNPQKTYQNDGKIVCTMLWSDGKRKGCREGIEAFKGAKERHPEMELIMFGIPERPDLDFEFEYYQKVERKDLVKIYNRTDIFIWPSIFEGWGLTPIEAMACKCAVVGSNVASMLEIGKDGYNALLSVPGNANELKDNILRVCEDINLQKSLSEHGCESVKQLSWDKSVEKLMKIINR